MFVPDVDNPGYFPLIFGVIWAVLDYLRLNPGYLPPIYRHIVIHCLCLVCTNNANLRFAHLSFLHRRQAQTDSDGASNY